MYGEFYKSDYQMFKLASEWGIALLAILQIYGGTWKNLRNIKAHLYLLESWLCWSWQTVESLRRPGDANIWLGCTGPVHKSESHSANNIWEHCLVQIRERSVVRLHSFAFLFQHIFQSDHVKAGSWRIKRYRKD